MNLYKNEDIESIEYKTNQIFVKWEMTTWCNYHCPYCIQKSRFDDGIKFDDEARILSVAKKLNGLLSKKNKPLFLRLLGGECTYYNLEKVLDEFSTITTLTLVTNFSRNLEYFYSLYSYCRSRNIALNLILSYHEENLDFWNKAKLLTKWTQQNHFKIPEISVVVDDNSDMDFLLQQKIENNLKIKAVIRKAQHNVKAEVSSEILAKLDEINSIKSLSKGAGAYTVTFKDGSIETFNSMSVFINNLDCGGFIPQNYYCDAGLSSLYINPAADVYRNPCGFLRREQFKLGNLLLDNCELPTSPILCTINSEIELQRCNLCHHNNLYRKRD